MPDTCAFPVPKESALPESSSARGALLRQPGFRWLLAGSLISSLGDQFTLVALPWLVLKLSGSAATLGLVLGLMSLPRAVFILFGGALVDRHSPKAVLLLTRYANVLLLGLLAALVLSGHARLGLVAALAFGIGLASAFAIPSGTSILPNLVAPGELQAANGMLMGIRQLSMLAGPLLAGLLFALGGDASAGMQDAAGLGLAFAFDCASFAWSAWTLSKVPVRTPARGPREPILKSVGAAMLMVWNDTALRTCFLYWGLCACVLGGIGQVALPVLADQRLHGASSYGLLLALNGAGMLAGMAFSAVKGGLRIGNLGTTLLAIDAVVGVLLLALGQAASAWQAGLVFFALGVLGGFMQVAVFSWFQQRVRREMLGRAMSIFMFVFMGLAPLSATVTGWVMQRTSLGSLFAGAGLFLLAAAALAWAITPIRTIVDAPPNEQA